MYLENWLEVEHAQKSFWSYRDQFSRTNHHSRRCEAPETTSAKFPEKKTKFQKPKKALLRYLGFLNYYCIYIPRLSEKLAPFFKMLTKDRKVFVTPDLLEQFAEINKVLDRCCELALKQPLPNKRIPLMTDASI